MSLRMSPHLILFSTRKLFPLTPLLTCLGYNQGVFNILQLVLLYLMKIKDVTQQTNVRSLGTAANPLGGMIGVILRFVEVFFFPNIFENILPLYFKLLHLFIEELTQTLSQEYCTWREEIPQ